MPTAGSDCGWLSVALPSGDGIWGARIRRLRMRGANSVLSIASSGRLHSASTGASSVTMFAAAADSAAFGGLDGFLGTRASVGMDVVLVGLWLLLPVLAWSIVLVRRGRYATHKMLQLVIAGSLLAAIVVFEVDVRLVSDWKVRARPSPHLPIAHEPHVDLEHDDRRQERAGDHELEHLVRRIPPTPHEHDAPREHRQEQPQAHEHDIHPDRRPRAEKPVQAPEGGTVSGGGEHGHGRSSCGRRV